MKQPWKLPYSSNASGLTTSPARTDSHPIKRMVDGVTISSYNDSMPLLNHIRSAKRVNRRRLLSGTSTPWIPPSPYNRSQYIITQTGKGPFRDSNLARYYDGPVTPNMLSVAWSTRVDSVPGWLRGPSVTTPNTSNFELSNAIAMATTKARNDLGSAKAQLGEALATARKTADLFVDTVIPLARFILSTYRGDVRRAVEAATDVIDNMTPQQLRALIGIPGGIPKSVANKWLAFHYGWKPLASDVFGSYEILRDSFSRDPAMLVHGRGSSFVEVSGQTFCLPGSGKPQMDLSFEGIFQVRAQMTGRVQELGIMRAINQAGLINPASLAWELIPFSFVIDWFVPVGGVLSALSATSGLTFVGGHRTYRWSERYTGIPSGISAMSNDPPSVTYTKSGHDRETFSSFPLPAPYLKPFYTGGDRWATIASLLTNISSKWGR